MKSFLKLASVMAIAGGVMLNAEGMDAVRFGGIINRDGANDETAALHISDGHIVAVNQQNMNNDEEWFKVVVDADSYNPFLTINNLARLTVPLTLIENRDKPSLEQLNGGQLVAECVNDLINTFNTTQQGFINEWGRSNVTVLEGTALQVAALLAVDNVYSSY